MIWLIQRKHVTYTDPQNMLRIINSPRNLVLGNAVLPDVTASEWSSGICLRANFTGHTQVINDYNVLGMDRFGLQPVLSANNELYYLCSMVMHNNGPQYYCILWLHWTSHLSPTLCNTGVTQGVLRTPWNQFQADVARELRWRHG